MSGICRVDKTVNTYPEKELKNKCDAWIDAGQQYYIRLGWIKKTAEREGN